MEDSLKGTSALWVSDTQLKPGVPNDHVRWAGLYLADKRPTYLIHGGDHWDLPSLSSYDKGTKKAEGKRLKHDLESGNVGMDLLLKPLQKLNKKQVRQKKKLYNPIKKFHFGNHEERLIRHVNANPELGDFLGWETFGLEERGFETFEYLKVDMVNGVGFSHFQANEFSGRPLGGMMSTQLKTTGYSFVAGHKQCLDSAIKCNTNGTRYRGVIQGASHIHDEGYKGSQSNHYWRGILLLTEIEDGFYNLVEVSLDYLCKKYEGMTLKAFLNKKYPDMKGYCWGNT